MVGRVLQGMVLESFFESATCVFRSRDVLDVFTPDHVDFPVIKRGLLCCSFIVLIQLDGHNLRLANSL